MLLSHLLFLSLVCVTINGQVHRTFTCSRNPDAGATTPKADAPTTNVGATTTKAGATTPKAEAHTTNVGATTTKAGTTTTKAGATTPKADAPTTNVGATTTKTGTATTKAEETTPKADAPTTNVGATTTKTGTTTTKAGATSPKAKAPTTNVGATTTKADAPTTNVGATTIKAGATTNKAGATTTKAEATTTNGACSNSSIIDGSLTDCRAIYKAGCNKSGIYKITPNGWTEDPFEAYCDMETTVPNWNSCKRRGWTVFQRRVNGSVDFNRNWASYKDGFGQLDHEFWLGNEKLLYLTKEDRKHRLRIDLVSSSGTTYHACYRIFHIKEEGECTSCMRLDFVTTAVSWMVSAIRMVKHSVHMTGTILKVPTNVPISHRVVGGMEHVMGMTQTLTVSTVPPFTGKVLSKKKASYPMR